MKQKFNAYWAGYLYSPDLTLNKCPDYIDTVIIAFIGPNSNHQVETTFLCHIFKESQILSWIQDLKKRGIKILFSLLDTPQNHWNKVDFNIFGESLKEFVDKWKPDGFDIDAETGETTNQVESFVNLINCVKKVIGSKGIISYTCYEGKYSFDSHVFKQVRSKINYVQTMAYFDNFEGMKSLYNYYKEYFEDNIIIGVKAGTIQDSGTPLNEVYQICKWNENKKGVMLWTFNRDIFAFTHQKNLSWCKMINNNLIDNPSNYYCSIC